MLMSGSSMKGITLRKAASTSTGVFASWRAELPTSTSRSASRKGRTPNFAGTSAPSRSSIFSSSVPRTGSSTPKRFCITGFVSPAFQPTTRPWVGASARANFAWPQAAPAALSSVGGLGSGCIAA